MNFIVSAPGKIILAGEHSVVYGYKAIASSINLRCYAHINTKDVDKNLLTLRLTKIPFTLSLNQLDFSNLKNCLAKYNQTISFAYQSILSDYIDDNMVIDKQNEDIVKPGIIVFLDLYFQTMSDFMPVDITITSEFTYGCGLGSSAAYSTVLSTSLLVLSEKISLDNIKLSGELTESDLNLICNFAFRGEQIFHGTPSGIDNSISSFGKGITFQRLSGSIYKKMLKIPNLRVLIVNTNVKRCTKNVVEHVNKMMLKEPEKYHGWFSEIHDITNSIEELMIKNETGLVEEMNGHVEKNQELLRLLGVSHPAIEDIVDILKCYGISGKLTGAGWGGCVYGIVNEVTGVKLTEAMHHLSERGYESNLTELSCSGVDVIF